MIFAENLGVPEGPVVLDTRDRGFPVGPTRDD
jgi:hypothetical protein